MVLLTVLEVGKERGKGIYLVAIAIYKGGSNRANEHTSCPSWLDRASPYDGAMHFLKLTSVNGHSRGQVDRGSSLSYHVYPAAILVSATGHGSSGSRIREEIDWLMGIA